MKIASVSKAPDASVALSDTAKRRIVVGKSAPRSAGCSRPDRYRPGRRFGRPIEMTPDGLLQLMRKVAAAVPKSELPLCQPWENQGDHVDNARLVSAALWLYGYPISDWREEKIISNPNEMQRTQVTKPGERLEISVENGRWPPLSISRLQRLRLQI